MGRMFVEFGGRYLEWSSVTDSPVTSLMTKTELIRFIIQNRGYKEFYRYQRDLETLWETGTTSRMASKEHLMAHNRAGLKEKRVKTEAEMVQLYAPETLSSDLFTKSTPLDFSSKVVLSDPVGYGTSVFEVVEVVGQSKTAAYVKVRMDNDPELFDVLIELESGEVLTKNFEGLRAVNQEPAR